MPLKMYDANLCNFEEKFKSFASETPSNHISLILFLADKNPSSNLSWCPDCNRAEPVIYQKVADCNRDVALLRAFAGDRATWRKADHPWRVDQRFRLSGVPTLVRWVDGDIRGRLEDPEADIPEKIDSILN
ncbi:hypothetical protein AMTRI_Chr03g44700 [Amborella trichopoda]